MEFTVDAWEYLDSIARMAGITAGAADASNGTWSDTPLSGEWADGRTPASTYDDIATMAANGERGHDGRTGRIPYLYGEALADADDIADLLDIWEAGYAHGQTLAQRL